MFPSPSHRLTVDRFFNRALEPIDSRNSDSIWNFHTWTEVWMTRPDLLAAFDGWQVIDATPQEVSDGLFRCGPTSVTSVRTGEIRFNYGACCSELKLITRQLISFYKDGAFVYAEVNADEVYWMYDDINDAFKLLKVKTAS